MARRGLLERLNAGENILVAEGYMWEFSRRGYLSRGSVAPVTVIEHPELVKAMHREFVHSGSDVVLAFTYCAHREKMKKLDREDEVETLNKQALQIAKEVAYESGCLFAGGIAHTRHYDPDDPASIQTVKEMFKEMIEWAVEAGVDFIVGETFDVFSEAMLALQCIKDYGKGVPAVITIAPYVPDEMVDGVPVPEACRRLEEAGAAVVGLNCSRGPRTMIPLLKDVRKACKGPIAALPVTYRTYDHCKTMYTLKDSDTGEYIDPKNLDCVRCSTDDIVRFGKEAKEIGVQYIGLCCGNCAVYMRDLAEAYGRKPPASRFSEDLDISTIYTDKKISDTARRTQQYMKYGKNVDVN